MEESGKGEVGNVKLLGAINYVRISAMMMRGECAGGRGRKREGKLRNMDGRLTR